MPEAFQSTQSTRDPYHPHRSLLTIEEVRELSRLTPQRVCVDVLVNWLCIVAAWYAAYRWPTWWVYVLAFLVVGNRYYSLFIVGHDGLHRRLFSSITLNERFTDLFILGPIGAITRTGKRNHLAHHLHLSTAKDPDRHRHACFNKSDHAEFGLFLSGISGFWSSVSNVYFKKESKKTGDFESNRLGALDLTIIVGWQLLIWLGLSSVLGWWAPVALFYAPLYCLTYLTDNFRSFAEHSHPESDQKADLHRLVTYVAPRWELELFAPMNMNYHAALHLWPSIPYYNLPKADNMIRERNTSAELEWRSSYVDYLNVYWRALPIVGCGPS